MCKNAFSASETTILHIWLYLLRKPVYLKSLRCAYMKLRRISNFHFQMVYLANICVIIHLEMILNEMEKWLISPKTRYMYHHYGFGRHSKIDAVITLFQCKYHLHNIQCAKSRFQPLKRRYRPRACTYCARQCTWCHFNAHIWSCAEFQIFTLKCFI